jgi:hypothetical protein
MASEVQGQFGGLVSLTFAGATYVISDAEVEIEPATFDVSAKANQDGSAAYEMKPKLVAADVKFRNVNDTDWNAILLTVGNVTITEQTNGRTHLFTGTRMTGSSKVNLSTGEVTNLRFEGGTYQFVASS